MYLFKFIYFIYIFKICYKLLNLNDLQKKIKHITIFYICIFILV